MPKNKKPRKNKKKHDSPGVKHQNGRSQQALNEFKGNILSLYQQSKVKEALILSQQALKDFPNDLNLLTNAGAFAMVLGQLELAEKYMILSLKRNPDHVDAHNNLAILFLKQKKIDRAKDHYQKALQLNPNHADAHSNLANLFKEQNELDRAKDHYQNAIRINPNHVDAHYNLAILFKEQNELDLAKEQYQKALQLNPNHVDAHNNLANLFEEQKAFDQAKNHYQKAIHLNPNFVDAHYNLATLFQQKKDYDLAKDHYQKVLNLNPKHIRAHNNLASLFQQKKDYDLAKDHYQKALKINPNHVSAKFNLSLMQLTLNQLTEGWENYECRFHKDESNRTDIPPATSFPQYRGEDLTSKNLLVYCEQGFGDEIQFIRYLPLLKSKKGVQKIILVCQPALKTLFSSMESIDHLLSKNEFEKSNAQGIDYWVFMMSLPLHFNTVEETIPNTLPYLFSSKQQQDKWKRKLPQKNNAQTYHNFNIGLVWKGSKAHKNDENRSLSSLSALKPLWDLKEKLNNRINLNFISLQKGEGEEEAHQLQKEQSLIHLGTEIQDFSDSAAIVSQLDLVICVDTAMAHLAGSLNIPCWVLLPYYGTDWRWMEGRDDSPWYPEVVTLFRQSQDGEWTEVIQNIVNKLEGQLL